MKMLRASGASPTPHPRPQLPGHQGSGQTQGSTWKLWPGRRGSCGCGQVQAQLAGLRRDLGLELDGAWPVSCRDRARAVTGRGGRRALQVDGGPRGGRARLSWLEEPWERLGQQWE